MFAGIIAIRNIPCQTFLQFCNLISFESDINQLLEGILLINLLSRTFAVLAKDFADETTGFDVNLESNCRVWTLMFCLPLSLAFKKWILKRNRCLETNLLSATGVDVCD